MVTRANTAPKELQAAPPRARSSKRRLQIRNERGTYTADFLKLQRKWYVKLAQDGFEDIEHVNTDGSVSHLLDRSAVDISMKWRSDSARYYQLAGQWLHDKDWAGRAKSKRIWELHSMGWTHMEIAEATRENRREVGRIVDLEAEAMLAACKDSLPWAPNRAHATQTRDSGYEGGGDE